jgi:hypothetical protein
VSAVDYRAALGDSQQEFPGYDQFGVADPEAVYAYELALKLHEGARRSIPRLIGLGSPAAGADFAPQAVPQGATWVLCTAFGVLTCSATVATRVPRILLDDTNTTFAAIAAQSGFTASQVGRHTFARALGATLSGTINGTVTPLPLIPLPGGFRVSFSTVAIDGADQWSGGALYAIETTEATWTERADRLREVVTGAHADLYPGLERAL